MGIMERVDDLAMRLPVFMGGNEFVSLMYDSRVVWFQGRPGDGKTTAAVICAYHWLLSGRFARVYSNFPVVFGTTPLEPIMNNGEVSKDENGNFLTREIGDNFDFLADYAKDAIILIDEAGMLVEQLKEYRKVFGFPRKNNQMIILSSTIPVVNATSFCNLFVARAYLDFFRYQPTKMGIPIQIWGHSMRPIEKGKYAQIDGKFGMVCNFRAYNMFATKYKPPSHYPIAQQDVGVFYDTQSRRIPKELNKYFFINSEGLCERNPKLQPHEVALLERHLPKSFNVNDAIGRAKISMKRKRAKAWIGGEFSFPLFIQIIFIFYIMAVMAVFGMRVLLAAQHSTSDNTIFQIAKRNKWSILTFGTWDYKGENDGNKDNDN